MAWEQHERIAELDINPVLVRPEGQGMVVADALVVLRSSANSRFSGPAVAAPNLHVRIRTIVIPCLIHK